MALPLAGGCAELGVAYEQLSRHVDEILAHGGRIGATKVTMGAAAVAALVCPPLLIPVALAAGGAEVGDMVVVHRHAKRLRRLCQRFNGADARLLEAAGRASAEAGLDLVAKKARKLGAHILPPATDALASLPASFALQALAFADQLATQQVAAVARAKAGGAAGAKVAGAGLGRVAAKAAGSVVAAGVAVWSIGQGVERLLGQGAPELEAVRLRQEAREALGKRTALIEVVEAAHAAHLSRRDALVDIWQAAAQGAVFGCPSLLYSLAMGGEVPPCDPAVEGEVRARLSRSGADMEAVMGLLKQSADRRSRRPLVFIVQASADCPVAARRAQELAASLLQDRPDWLVVLVPGLPTLALVQWLRRSAGGTAEVRLAYIVGHAAHPQASGAALDLAEKALLVAALGSRADNCPLVWLGFDGAQLALDWDAGFGPLWDLWPRWHCTCGLGGAEVGAAEWRRYTLEARKDGQPHGSDADGEDALWRWSFLPQHQRAPRLPGTCPAPGSGGQVPPTP